MNLGKTSTGPARDDKNATASLIFVEKPLTFIMCIKYFY